MAGYKLYGSRGTGSDIVEILLRQFGQDVTFVETYGEVLHEAPFKAKNPLSKVPALDLPDGTTIFESAAMILHLCAAHAGPLAPRPGTPDYAHFCQWTVFLSANLYETVLRFNYPDRYTAASDGAEGVKAQASTDLFELFQIVEDRLAPFLLGAEMSAADLYLAMLTLWCVDDLGFGADRFPKVMAALEAAFDHDVAGPIFREAQAVYA
ncbi:MAG: glutathione S-transferase family protein [Pseudomonadota bacterium]